MIYKKKLTEELEEVLASACCPQKLIIIKRGALEVVSPYNWIILDENEGIEAIEIYYGKGSIKWKVNFNMVLADFHSILFGAEWIPEIVMPSGENFCLLPEGWNKRSKKQNQPMLCGIGG
ncbi:MAG: hypothetical protein PHI66_02050 [Candidatus Pacebacteria bacterium]|nr:hypothetical protein [Candidatus Paceibacterota bacterium]